MMSLRNNMRYLQIFTILLFICSCDNTQPLFTKLSPHKTNVTFNNALTETDTFNYFLFSYMYMGGGVSVADFNHDGLTDIYFTGNMVRNRLYLNQGSLKFMDVTEESNTGGDGQWMLGSTVCDINDDGLPDIYVSVSGLSDNCRNLLFINQGNNEKGIPIFAEKAAQYGIDDNGKSTQGTFFDYDNDGDLDLYVANYPITNFKAPPYFYRQMMRNAKIKESSNLYRNNGDSTFTNVTAQAGLLNFGLSLSATASDLNKDGFKDLYVSNDFTSPDFFYFNNGDGTFTDRTAQVTGQTSFYGMGADIADYNNDGYPDILQIDMAPEFNKRAKENMSTMTREDFEEMVQNGLHYQYRYSTLQLNRGTYKDGLAYFSNAAWLAGVTSTDWSWAGLFADFDLDGWKDIFITNGSRRDMNNIDYFNKIGQPEYFNKSQNSDWLEKVRNMPAKPLVNYIFRNNCDLTFKKTNMEWGIQERTYSNGAAYADLDNDGDLELIVNNIDSKAIIYKNNARETNRGNYLKIELEGTDKNKMGLGTVATIYAGGSMQTSELTLSRGYESSMEPVIYFGTGNKTIVDSIVVKWPDGKKQVLTQVETNKTIFLNYKDATALSEPQNTKQFVDRTCDKQVAYAHKENPYNDFEKQVLLPHKLSAEGPDIAVGDVNGDGLADFFTGNAVGSPAAIFLQQNEGSFTMLNGPWQEDTGFEDAGTLLFDADTDGDLDLYVVSGGNEFPEGSPQYQDRIYVNNGKGSFIKDMEALPSETVSGSCVINLDYDNDGDQDLFIGGRHVPGKYPYSAPSCLLENQSSSSDLRFLDVTQSAAPELLKAGMVTAAYSADADNDGWPELIVAGEWMPVCIYKNTNGHFKKTEIPGSEGWWFSLNGADFDNDGDTDLVAGNIGLNMRYKADPDKTFDVYADDFDGDGRSDIALCYYEGSKQYPLRSRPCYLSQNPGLEKKFPTYKSFAEATIKEIYSQEALNKALHLQVRTFASCYFENTGNGQFKMKSLPNEAQLSAINDMIISDFDQDGLMDILAAGNLFDIEMVTPRNDAGAGIFLKGDGKGNFSFVPPSATGFFVPGNVKSLALIETKDHTHFKKKTIAVGNNNDRMQFFEIK